MDGERVPSKLRSKSHETMLTIKAHMRKQSIARGGAYVHDTLLAELSLIVLNCALVSMV